MPVISNEKNTTKNEKKKKKKLEQRERDIPKIERAAIYIGRGFEREGDRGVENQRCEREGE